MALGTTVAFKTEAAGLSRTDPSNGCPWQTVVDAYNGTDGGPEVVNTNLTNPGLATLSTRHIMTRNASAGKYLQLALKYDDGVTGVTSPVVKVFGRFANTDRWGVLENRAGSVTGTLTIDLTNDAQDGTYSYTTVSAVNSTWHVSGCDEILVLVSTAFAATGTTTTSSIQGKLF